MFASWARAVLALLLLALCAPASQALALGAPAPGPAGKLNAYVYRYECYINFVGYRECRRLLVNVLGRKLLRETGDSPGRKMLSAAAAGGQRLQRPPHKDAHKLVRAGCDGSEDDVAACLGRKLQEVHDAK